MKYARISHLSLGVLTTIVVAAYEDHSRKLPAPVADTFSAS